MNPEAIPCGQGKPDRFHTTRWSVVLACAGSDAGEETARKALDQLCKTYWRPVFAFMLISFLVVMGLFSFFRIGVDLFPRSDPVTVYVQVRLPGASPEEVTSQVVMPLEEAIASVSFILPPPPRAGWHYTGDSAHLERRSGRKSLYCMRYRFQFARREPKKSLRNSCDINSLRRYVQ